MRRRMLPLALALFLTSCGGGNNPAPSPSPSPSPAPSPTPTTYALRGTVTEEYPFGNVKIAGAKVAFVDGSNAGKSATTDAVGDYAILNANTGGFTVRVTADGYREKSVGVTLTRDVTQNFALAADGPRRKFGPGQYHVNTEIASGRYFSSPRYGCYFERQRGFSGSLGDIIANEFIGFDADQWIVDIRSSDVGFETSDECGNWYNNSPRTGAQVSIPPGAWLVGSQVTPGRYRASTQAGCYWERLRDFTGTLNGVIDNDFVSGGGSRIVEIRRSDVGFRTDDECGPWARIASLEAPEALPRSERSIDENRALARTRRSDPRLRAGE